MVKTKKIEAVDEDGAALDLIAKSRFLKTVSGLGDSSDTLLDVA